MRIKADKKTQDQPASELTDLQQRISKLEALYAKSKKREEASRQSLARLHALEEDRKKKESRHLARCAATGIVGENPGDTRTRQ